MDTGNLSDAEFKTLVIRMLSELRGRADELSENFNKDIGNTDRKHKTTSQKRRIHYRESTME